MKNKNNGGDKQSSSQFERGENINITDMRNSNFSNPPLLTDNNIESLAQQAADRKRSIIKYSIMAIVVILSMGALVGLSMTTVQPKPVPPTPDVPGPPKPPVQNFNPYTTVDLVDNQDQISGTMSGQPSINKLSQLLEGMEATISTNKGSFGKNADLIPQGPNNEFIKKLSYQMYMTGYQGAYLNIAEAESTKRWAIPDWIVKKKGKDANMRLNMLGLTYQTNPFSFSFNSLANPNEWYLKSTGGSLVFMDKYIQMDFMLPTQRIFGLGERVREFGLKEGAWTMWTRGDGESAYDDGKGGKGTYGVHPFVLAQTKSPGEFIGMFFRNSNHQTVIIRHNEDRGSTLSYITTGGNLEVYFLIRGSANWVISQYQELVGRPNLPPFWSLGFAQSSYAYNDEQTLRNVIESYNSSDIPLETIFVDIPYMDNFKTFTVNEARFPNFKNFARELHNNGQQIVLVLDPALSVIDDHYYYYQLAQEKEALIHSKLNPLPKYKNALITKVYPERAAFLDWLNEHSNVVWKQGMKDLYAKVPYDGLWLDMNENMAFVNGELSNLQQSDLSSQVHNDYEATDNQNSQTKRVLQQSRDQALEERGWYNVYKDQSQASTFYMPFIAGSQNPDYMTLSLNATHVGGVKEYDFHSLNGHMMSRATFSQWLSDDFPLKDKRVFILSRSTFAGSGQYASHWLGDNWRTWEHMRFSISGIMNMNMFGIPHTGADVCGYLGKQDHELCARWMQLAVFYPFARNHYNATFEGKVEPGELYTLKEEWKNMAKDAVYQRFEYLRLMYTCLQEVSFDGQTCFSPLFFYYPEDDNTFIDTEHTFMVGGGHLKVSPVLNASVESIVSYFPKGTWVSMNNFSDTIVLESGKYISLSAKSKYIQVHLREGSIIPWQPNRENKIKRTAELVDGKMLLSLVINRNPSQNAQGSLFLASGLNRAELDSGQYEKYQIVMNGKYVNFQLTNGQRGAQFQTHKLQNIIITNAMDLMFTRWACFIQELDRKPIPLQFKFDEASKTLTITFDRGIPPSIIRDIYFGGDGDINMCVDVGYNIKVGVGETVNLNKNQASFILEGRDRELPNLIVKLSLLQSNTVKVYINFENPFSRQRVPFEVPGVMSGAAQALSDSEILANYVQITYYPFTLSAIDERNATIYFLDSLVFHEYIVSMTAMLNVTRGDDFWGIYGLGEKVQNSLFYEDGVYTLWSRDAGDPLEDGKSPGKNIYGTHPVYFGKNDVNSHFGVFNLNAAAQDWIIQNNIFLGDIKVTSIATGGVIELYLMTGQTPEQVVQKYHSLIGLANFPPPKWALGWHQCRWGYQKLSDIQEVVAKYKEHNIPLDVMWSDIDYMDSYKDFTYDKQRYKELPQFVKQLHTQNQYYIPIMDAGIAWRPNSTYKSYNEGVQANAFIKARNGEDFVGRVWPNEAVYVDFNAERGRTFWRQQLENFYSEVQFDGLWLDMNEASNFCNGACLDQQKVLDPLQNKFLYLPGNRNLETKSIALDATHDGNLTEGDLHSLYGYMQSKATAFWFLQHQKRPMIIARSTFAGNHAFGGYHWLGDNQSTEQYMGWSVTGNMMMNIFGIAFVGADICGFGENTNAELCARWTVVGSFYPFARNHNSVGAVPQEPYVWQEQYEPGIKYVDIHKMAIRNRYHLTSYYYTCLYLQTFGGTFYKPLFFEFPNDNYAARDAQNNVMLGSALKLSVLSNKIGQNETAFYFPKGTWCNIYKLDQQCIVSRGTYIWDLKTKAYDFYVHLREGFIVPMIDATKYNISTIAQLADRQTDFHILTTPSTTQPNHTIAAGQLYNDDGVTITPFYNSYIILADIAQGQNISIKFITTQIPAKEEQGCMAINKNDYLGDLYIYNTTANGFSEGNYTGKSYLKNGTEIELKDIKYEPSWNKVILTGYNECIALIREIVLTKKAN